MWSRSEIVVMITLGREKLMQHNVARSSWGDWTVCRRSPRRVELRWPVSRVDTGPDSTTDDSFDAMSIICRHEAPTRHWTCRAFWRERRICCRPTAMPGCSCRGGWWRAVTAHINKDLRNFSKILIVRPKDDISDMFTHGELVCDSDAEYFVFSTGHGVLIAYHTGIPVVYRH